MVGPNTSNESDSIWPFPFKTQLAPSRVLGRPHYFPQDQISRGQGLGFNSLIISLLKFLLGISHLYVTTSYLSSAKSRLSRSNWWLSSSMNWFVLKVGNPNSKGITAFDL